MAREDAADRAPADFPANLRVVLVEDDHASLVILKKMLEDCSYHVVACRSGEEALETLRNSQYGFDIVMSDVRMPGIDGLQLLAEITTMKIDSPVILFSDEPEKDVILKGIHGGACDFLAKPIHISTLKIIWKYLLRKMKSSGKETGPPDTQIASLFLHPDQQISQSNERLNFNPMKRKRGGDSFDSSSIKETEQADQSNATEAATATKKSRMSWKLEAHNAFLEAIAIAPEKPLPKKIQEYMETKHGIKGLTRQIISSHLQKHRENIKKLHGIPIDPRITKQAIGYGIRAPPPLPPSSQNLSSISWEMPSRHQAPTTQVYSLSQPMYKMVPQPNYLQRFPGNLFTQNLSGGYDAFIPSQPPARQIPWNPSVSPMIREQSYPGVSINSTIQTAPTNIYSTGMESSGQQLPLHGSGGVYHSNESCISNVLAQGESVDSSIPAMTLEQDEADNWLNELSFEDVFQDSEFW